MLPHTTVHVGAMDQCVESLVGGSPALAMSPISPRPSTRQVVASRDQLILMVDHAEMLVQTLLRRQDALVTALNSGPDAWDLVAGGARATRKERLLHLIPRRNRHSRLY